MRGRESVINRSQQSSKKADGRGGDGKEILPSKHIFLQFCTTSLTKKSPEELPELSDVYLPVACAFQAIKLFLQYHLMIFFLSLLLSAPRLLEEKVGGKSVACQQEAQWCFRELFP